MNIFGQIFLSASVFMIISISLERRFAVCHPHAYRIHIKTIPLWKHLSFYLVPVLTTSVFLNLPIIINSIVSVEIECLNSEHFLFLQTKLKKNQLYVKINLYLRAVSVFFKHRILCTYSHLLTDVFFCILDTSINDYRLDASLVIDRPQYLCGKRYCQLEQTTSITMST